MKLLAPLLLAALPAFGEGLAVQCAEIEGVPACLITEADLDKLLAANHRAKVIIEQALKRIQELEAKPPKCAELEVIPKPPKHPPIKRESDS